MVCADENKEIKTLKKEFEDKLKLLKDSLCPIDFIALYFTKPKQQNNETRHKRL